MAEKQLLQDCKMDFDSQLIQFSKMKSYYDGNTDALMFYQMVTERANNKINCNYIQKFINEEASYCVGNKITYTSYSNNTNVIDDIRLNTKHWSEKHDRELCKQSLIFNQAYELIYLNNGLFSSMICTPQNSYVLKDDYDNVQLFIRFFKKKFDNLSQYADVYEGNTITHYKIEGNTFNEIGNVDTHIFSRVPVSIIEVGTIYESLFTNLKGLQDGYETVLSDIVNEISDFRNAYLKLIGCKFEEEDLVKMKELGVMQLPNKDADADWLIKNLNDQFVQNTLNTLQDNIYMQSSHINHNEKLASNTSSLALRNRLIALEQKCTNNIQSIQDCIKSRLQFLFEFLYIKSSKTYDYRDIDIKLTPNIPSDDLLVSQILSQNPNISKKTGYGLYSFISNPDNEMKQKELEDNANSIGADLLNGGEY